MCGIVGFFTNKSGDYTEMMNLAFNMARVIEYRGPNDEGAWSDPDAGIALGHKRLSILDLTTAGHQPMVSGDGSLCLVFNGEIYNHEEIRLQLSDFMTQHGRRWVGHSDTETLLVALEVWGMAKTLQKLSGMFAFALWNKRDNTLSLARDRMGEKPLYYGFQNQQFIFASELKALREFPSFEFDVNRDSLAAFLRYNYVPSPYSIYRDVYKLIPGTWLQISYAQLETCQVPMPKPYWSLQNIIETRNDRICSLGEIETIDELDRLLKQAVSSQMVSDVQLGGLLSGGIDSSLIVSLMQAQSSMAIKTFTIGFEDRRYNEAQHAKLVADYLKTDHTELYVTDKDMLETVHRLPYLYDEPFADASQIPTFLVCQLARQHVTVALSGDGGDELFGGYNRYTSAVAVWRKFSFLPHGLRAAIAGVLTSFSPEHWDKIFQCLDVFIPRKWRHKTLGDKLHKTAQMLSCYSSEEIYQEIVSHWKSPEHIVYGVGHTIINANPSLTLAELEYRMMYLDSITYLPDDVLTKVDRAAMGVSLETRVPFLDPRIISAAWNIPLNMKIRDGKGKWVLRQLLERYIPCSLIDRPKTGFSVPIDAWLKGPLKEWAMDLLSDHRIKDQGIFKPDIIQYYVNDYFSGKYSNHNNLWSLLMYQSWHSHYIQKG